MQRFSLSRGAQQNRCVRIGWKREGDALLGGHDIADTLPTQINPFFLQLMAQRVYQMIGQQTNE